MRQESIVRFWHAVELLTPQSAPKKTPRSRKPTDPFIDDTKIQSPTLPWAPASQLSKQRLPEKRVWSHTLFAHVYDSRLVAEKLKEAYGAEQGYRETRDRESALFAAKFTMGGELVDDSFVLSSEAWFLGRVLMGMDWTTRSFKEDQKAIGHHAKTLFEGRVSGEALREVTRFVLDSIGVAGFFGDMDEHVFRFRSQPVNPQNPESEDDPLNSFLLDDLDAVADSISNNRKSEPLDRYLSRHKPQGRLHIDDDRTSLQLIDHLMPDAHAMSCWPSERHLGLVHSQQLAVNIALKTLGNGEGLLGINGPPGTGKTTLLRDLIASIVTSRADVLSKLRRASDGFVVNGREEVHDKIACFKLNPALYGFEIVVASSNNGAVENVTLELPQRDKVDHSWLPEVEYFPELGELVSGKPAWGMISGALGSKMRRAHFVRCYFKGRRPNGSEGLANGPADNQEGSKGFLGWLNGRAEVNNTRSPEDRQALWEQAVADYQAAKAEVRKTCADANRIRKVLNALLSTRGKVKVQSEALHTLEGQLAETENQLSHLDAEESHPASVALKLCLDALEEHHACKPGFWAKVLSFWGAQRDWDTKRQLLEGRQDLAKSQYSRIARLTVQLEASRERLEKQSADARRALERLRGECQAQTQDALDVAKGGQAVHLLAFLKDDVIGRGDAIELAEPWRIKGWRQARARVFIKALELHRLFFELEARRMRSNLFFINELLTGARYAGVSPDAIRSAWASLFMVVPVLSSTFASFARSFGSLGAGEIGWLLVDEAGQASPQSAVGALWRSRRALLVGDPLQLKPIVTVSDAVLEHMRTRYRVHKHWLPNRQSAQTLADEVTPWGRMSGPADGKTWVGLPLVVHRRCDKPMHEVANRIAYDGAMVYGTPAPRAEEETPASLKTGWIQAKGVAQNNWVPAEGEALRELLTLLEKDGVELKDISVITPFKEVQENLRRMLGDKMVCGTIHTMQGKEAPIVILVLGGSPGARDWAVSEPNLLNVAATRAKRRLYVIGDRDDWKQRALFCDVIDLLPRRKIPVRERENMPFSQ